MIFPYTLQSVVKVSVIEWHSGRRKFELNRKRCSILAKDDAHHRQGAWAPMITGPNVPGMTCTRQKPSPQIPLTSPFNVWEKNCCVQMCKSNSWCLSFNLNKGEKSWVQPLNKRRGQACHLRQRVVLWHYGICKLVLFWLSRSLLR